MKIVFGDMWKYPAQVTCITTNGIVKKDGRAVMGVGVAEQALIRFPGLDKELADSIKREGLKVSALSPEGADRMLLSFPVKYDWRDPADLDLIKKSADELAEIAKSTPTLIFVLPRPGCGYGQRTWKEVEPLLKNLPDNVHVINKV